jgi:hypothetical protein
MLDAGRIGRQTAFGPEAQAKRANTQRKNALAQHAWISSDRPAFLTDRFYSERVQPALAATSASSIARQISVSRWYAGRIREGYCPHRRHWQALAQLVGLAAVFTEERANCPADERRAVSCSKLKFERQLARGADRRFDTGDSSRHSDPLPK